MNNNTILKGSIFITSDIEVVTSYPIGIDNKIITLDEEGLLQEDNQNIIGGSCLLPPMLAKIAESDGNEFDYEAIYKEHLLDSYQQGFIGALIAALYKNKNLLLFLPELGYTYTRDRLVTFIFQLYGISIGMIQFDKNTGSSQIISPCYYDITAIPIWLNLIYEAKIISPYEYLINYPIDADMKSNMKIMNLLMSDLKPYGTTINDKIDTILEFHKKLHKNPNIKLPIHSLI